MDNPITQSDLGDSLAQLYDTRGTQFGGPSAEIEADRILLVHELGMVGFAERFRMGVRRIESLGVAQSANFDAVITDLPNDIFRVMGCTAFTEDGVAGQVNDLALFMRDENDEREVPFFAFDTSSSTEINLRLAADATLGVINALAFIQDAAFNPGVLGPVIGSRLRKDATGTRAIAMRGRTTAFGAGTLNIRANILIGSVVPGPGNIHSFGLPVPSW